MIGYTKQRPLNPHVTGNMPDVARGDILSEKTFFSPFPGKAETEETKIFWKLMSSLLMETQEITTVYCRLYGVMVGRGCTDNPQHML